MAEITAAQVKELRDKTGAGMMDCKKALIENDGDMENAVDWLRKQGLAAAAKKAGRIASEGLVGLIADGQRGAIAEVNAETDFVARNEEFQTFVEAVTGLALTHSGDLDAVKAADHPNGSGSVAENLTNMIATIGENMDIRRLAAIEVDEGVIAAYMHGAQKPGLGKIGVLVGLGSSGDGQKLAAFGKQLAMHVAAANPQALSIEEVDAGELERERKVLTEQARESGKPDNIIEKMVEGRLRKYYEEICLLEQIYVIDNESKVSKAIETFAGELGAPVKVSGFIRFALGEGLEKKEENFAAEVAATVGA